MQELENLLNSLIQRGWKPAGFPGKSEIKISEDEGVVLYMNAEDVTLAIKVKLRNLVSIESGLWQFVCENSLIKQCKGTICKNPKTYWNAWSIQWEWWYWCDIAEYRLLESALIPEEELGKFLIDNIDIKNLKSLEKGIKKNIK